MSKGPQASREPLCLPRTAVPQMLGMGPTQSDDGTPTNRQSIINMFCCWSVGFLTAIDGTISQPSMWKYVQSLNGSSVDYSMCIMAFPICRFAFMGVYAGWAERRPYKEVFVVSAVLSMLSGLLYALGPTFDGIWPVLVARGILGATSCQSLVTQAFISRHTTKEERTSKMSINSLVSSTLKVCGPGFNGFLVKLPVGVLSMGVAQMVFNSYTWVGYFMMVAQAMALIFVCACFEEPEVRARKSRNTIIDDAASLPGKVATLWGCFPYGRIWVDSWLRQTGAWVILIFNFRTQLTDFAVTWSIPLITDRDYHFGQMQNSLIFATFAVESVLSSTLVGWASKKMQNRDLVGIWQLFSWSGLIAYSLLSGFGQWRIPLPLFLAILVCYDFGVAAPQTQSLYSELVGQGRLPQYFAVLQANGALARIFSANLIGFTWGAANEELGSPHVKWLWIGIHAFFLMQWAIYLSYFPALDRGAISDHHEVLRAERRQRQADEDAKKQRLLDVEPPAQVPSLRSLSHGSREISNITTNSDNLIEVYTEETPDLCLSQWLEEVPLRGSGSNTSGARLAGPSPTGQGGSAFGSAGGSAAGR